MGDRTLSSLAEVLSGPPVPDASCRGVAPEWDRVIPGEALTAREARIQLARRVCRRCPALARCLELLDELDGDIHDVVMAGAVIDSAGRRTTPPWRLADAVPPDHVLVGPTPGGRGVEITETTPLDTARPTACTASRRLEPSGSAGESRPGATP